jgi:Family of unknown function (DUF6339)
MTTEFFLFPRFSPRVARLNLEKIQGKSPLQLTSLAGTDSADAVYPATGGGRVGQQVLADLRRRLLDCAKTLGFPDPEDAEAVKFDHEAAGILLQHLPIAPAEASRDEVWSFISLCLLPDLATWRFPDQNSRRFLGGVRNTFQRLWWRAAMLKDDTVSDSLWLIRLPEDALVGLMERPGISSNNVVARSIARSIAKLAESLPTPLREDGWRAAYKRIRQRIPLVNLESLPEPALAEQLDTLCQAAMSEVRASSQR